MTGVRLSTSGRRCTFVLGGYEKSGALPVLAGQASRSLAIHAIYSHFLGIRCVVIKSPARLHTSRWQQNLVKLVKLTKSGAASAENGVRSTYPCTRVQRSPGVRTLFKLASTVTPGCPGTRCPGTLVVPYEYP